MKLSPHEAARLTAELEKSFSENHPLNLRCKAQADKYIEASNVLDAHMKASTNANMAPAMIMCMSFALELLFKALILIDRDDILHIAQLSKVERERLSTHRVPDLFDQISPQHRQRLADIYCARQGVPRLAVDRFRSELVEKANSLFTEWRYVHESDPNEMRHIDMSVVSNLIAAALLLGAEVKG